jgi:hypothetical protein
MKTAILATAMLISATAASAAGLEFTIVGNAEYAIEAEAVETNLGAELALMPNLTVKPLVTFAGTTDAFEFTGVELGATYSVTGNVDVYGVVEADADFEYSEATLGVSFAF